MLPRFSVKRPTVRNMGASCDYTTEDELLFLRELGQWCEHTRTDRATLLRQYIKSVGLRRIWGQIDRKQCMATALDMLLRESGHVCPEVS